ncbi:IS3 family transposase [Mesobacillus zeae]|uniref:HTH-like domain-containing protein n=1 Tax=Mesobacillus zeae TaxID=1917180 RepID=A0A398B6F1_9BACI|nr:hypothetical protein D1970_17280 [Mesobacillus zeae]
MCQVLGVSKSGYYDWLKREESPRKQSRKALIREIKKIYFESKKRYGSIKITRKLHGQGIKVSERHLQRIMTSEGITGPQANGFAFPRFPLQCAV